VIKLVSVWKTHTHLGGSGFSCKLLVAVVPASSQKPSTLPCESRQTSSCDHWPLLEVFTKLYGYGA